MPPLKKITFMNIFIVIFNMAISWTKILNTYNEWYIMNTKLDANTSFFEEMGKKSQLDRKSTQI